MKSLQLQPFHFSKEENVAAAKAWARRLHFFLSIGKSDAHRVVMFKEETDNELKVKQLEQSNAIVL